MNANPDHPLDNPAWYALNSHHREFAVGNEIVKRYRHEIAPFVACKPGHEVEFDQLNEWLSDGEIFYFIGDASSNKIDCTSRSLFWAPKKSLKRQIHVQ